MSGQCLCSWCVEARQRAREAETAGLRDLAAYDQSRHLAPAGLRYLRVDEHRAEAERLFALRFEARKKTGATCP